MCETLLWCAVRTRSNSERLVSESFNEMGIQNYLPSFHEVRQWTDRKKIIEVPIFPGYLFAKITDSRQKQLSILYTQGVVDILRCGERIEVVPEQEIESIRQLLQRGRAIGVHPLVREGAWVRIKRGALKGAEGLLVRVKGATRFVVSITLLSRSLSAEVDSSDVQFLRSCTRDGWQVA